LTYRLPTLANLFKFIELCFYVVLPGAYDDYQLFAGVEDALCFVWQESKKREKEG